MVQTYSLNIQLKRINNGFTVKVNSSDNDGLEKFYPDEDEMTTDLKAHFENKLAALESDYQHYLTTLLKVEDIRFSPVSNSKLNLIWDLVTEDLFPKSYVIEYQVNGGGWVNDGIISNKKNWGQARLSKQADLELPSPLSEEDELDIRIKGTHDGFPDGAWSDVFSVTWVDRSSDV